MRAEMNTRLTRTDVGTPMGRLLRDYWQPVALSEQLVGERPLCPVTIMGERLVLFKTESGQLALMDRHCAHRGADLCYGRLENNGLRCPFHGWLYDGHGQCVETPAEPVESTFHHSIRLRNYPCIERNGVIFAWLGSSEPSALPELDCLQVPQSHSFAFKGLMECNWLQALEVGIDPAHASYLHRYLVDDDPQDGYGKQFRDAAHGGNVPITHILREYARPQLSVEPTEYGMRLIARRQLDDEHCHVRITHQVFPQAIVIPMSREMTITQWHVPVTDTQSYWYAMFTSYDTPCDQELMRKQRLALYELPDYKPRIGRHNDYGYNAEEQRTRTYSGMGDDINVHDQWAVESPGKIQDRTKEHLGSTDIGIIENRRRLNRLLRVFDKEAPDSEASASRDSVGRQEPEPGDFGELIAIDVVTQNENWRANALAAGIEQQHNAGWNAERKNIHRTTDEAGDSGNEIQQESAGSVKA